MTTGPLHGHHVIECGHRVAAAYAAKLMADLGAEVIKVEEPEGDAARRHGPYPGDIPHLEKSGLCRYCQVVGEAEEELLVSITVGYIYAACGSPLISLQVANACVRSVR